MANYTASARSNYFRVKDEDAFQREMDGVPNIKCHRDKDGRFMIHETMGEGWPGFRYDEETDEEVEIDVAEIVYPHLADGEVAILMESGHEKLRYVTGYAVAINQRGERRSLNLSDIYEQARRWARTSLPRNTEEVPMEERKLPPTTVRKLQRIRSGEVVTVSDGEFELIAPHLDNDVVSIPNPRRLGVFDSLRVGRVNAEEMRAYRLQYGLEDE